MDNPWAKYTSPEKTAAELRELGTENGPCAAAADQIEALAEAVRAYLREYDNPVADYVLRRRLRERLAEIVGK